MAPVLIALMQIKMQQCKSAMDVLARCDSKLQTSIVLVQETWLHKGNILGLYNYRQFFSANRLDVKACILVKGFRYFVLLCGLSILEQI